MVKQEYMDSMSRSVSSSPVNSEVSIDINDTDDEVSHTSQSPKREPMSSPNVHNSSVNSSKPSKLSFSISRLLSANSDQNKPNRSIVTSEANLSAMLSQCPASNTNETVIPYPLSSSSENKCQSQRMPIAPYDQTSLLRVHRPPPNIPYSTHYPWLGPTSSALKESLQSKTYLLLS